VGTGRLEVGEQVGAVAGPDEIEGIGGEPGLRDGRVEGGQGARLSGNGAAIRCAQGPGKVVT
jgi:hypothetical protein